MNAADRVWLGATGRRPAVEVLSVPGELRFPFSLPGDAGAFDHAIPRVGWVAVQVGETVLGLQDGDWWRPVELGTSWGLTPAADPELLIVKRTVVGAPEGTVSVEVIDRSGRVSRSIQTSWVNVAGELEDGTLVCLQGLLGTDGRLRALPWDGEPIAVLGGRHVLLAEGSRWANVRRMTLLDVDGGSEVACDLPGTPFLLSPAFDATASYVALKQWEQPWVIVADASSEVRVIDVGYGQHAAAWDDHARLLLVGERHRVVLDVVSGEQIALPGLARDASPRIDVTGRFDFEAFKAAQSPRFVGPIPPAERDQLLGEELSALVEVVGKAGLPAEVSERALPAVRLRSCMAPSRIPLGASRFGGRPDLPKGHRWPQYEGAPMGFLAQLRCEELAAALPDSDIPTTGLLVVFTAVDGQDGAIYGDAVHIERIPTVRLVRRAWPSRLPEEARLTASIVSAEPMLSPPSRWELSLDDDQARALDDFVRTGGALHQFLGHLNTVQDVVLSDDEHQLLRLDSDPLNGTLYGDGGCLWITIPTRPPFDEALKQAYVEIDST
jgi:hypothetical protein